jgi:DNA repair exonuclease SbcCD nuclease subunit
MKKVISIAISDVHLHIWSQYNEDGRRNETGAMFLDKLRRLQKKFNVPVISPGDWFHSPKSLSNESLNKYIPLICNIKYPIYILPGNHDMDGVNNNDKTAHSHITWLSYILAQGFSVTGSHQLHTGITLWGVPYYDHNIGLMDKIQSYIKSFKPGQKNILMIHTDLPGAKDSDGMEVGQVQGIPENWGEVFAKFNLVLCGHIHKFQKLGPNVYMVGSPYHTRITDIGCKMGVLLVYDDFSVEFVDMGLPEFKLKGPGIKEDDYHIWIDKKKDTEEEDNDTPIGRKDFYTKDRVKLGQAYLKLKGITDPKKRNILLNALKNDGRD